MSWLTSLGIALLAAMAGMFTAVMASSLALGWIRLSAADGGHSLFGFFNGVYGFIGGFIAGLIVARLMAPGYTFVPSLLAAVGSVVGIIAAITLASRLLAAVPPRSGGEQMVLAVEVQWPASQLTPPRAGSGRAAVDLVSGRAAARREPGALFFAEPELRDGRWTIPGGVRLVTDHTVRSLELVLDDAISATFAITVKAEPSPRWSAWIAAADSDFSLRYRVLRAGDTYRTFSHGSFTVTAHVNDYIQWAQTRTGANPRGGIAIERHGAPLLDVPTQHEESTSVLDFSTVRRVVPVAGADALVVEALHLGCYLITATADAVRAEYITHCGHNVVIHEITSEPARFHADGVRLDAGPVRAGALERGRLYLFNSAILDTRSFTVHNLALSQWIEDVPYRAPLGVAPDGRSFVRVAYRTYHGERPALAVTDLRGEEPYTLDVRAAGEGDPLAAADPAWLLEHFEWLPHGDTWRLAPRVRAVR
jgi:hypothetical protein